MDINVNVQISGLEPLVEAIQKLAAAQTGAVGLADQAIDKAKRSKKTEPAPGVPAPEAPEPANTQPAALAGQDASTGTAEQPDAKATSLTEQPAENLTDEALRALAAAKAKVNRAQVKDIVNKYAESVTAVPLAKRAAFRAELEAVA